MRPIPTEARQPQPHPSHPRVVTDGGPDQPYQMVADQPTLINAPRRPAPQSSEWLARCRELAWEHALIGMAQPLGRGQFGDELWRVPSKSEPGTVHTVRCARVGGYRCDCVAGRYGNACGHVGSVLFHQDTQASVLNPREVAPADTTAEYRAWFAWCLGRPVAAAVTAAGTESNG